MTKPLAELPNETVKELQEFKETDTEKLREKIRALRGKGWTLRSIATALNVSRTTIQNWDKKATATDTDKLTDDALPTPSLFSYGSNVFPFKIPKDIPPKDIKVMQELREAAKNKTRWSDQNSKETKASQELDKYILKYSQRKVPLQTIAKHLSVTRRAVAQRIEKLEV